MMIKKLFLLFLIFLWVNIIYAQNTDNKMDTLSYSVGVLLAKNLKSQGFSNLNSMDVAKGVTDVINGDSLKISMAEAQNLVNSFAMDMARKKKAIVKEMGEKFLLENGQREGVITTESGLQYEIIEEGEGAMPSATDKVLVHYHGTLVDGTVFDSSIERGEPISFQVNGVIQGWQQALQLMKQGAKWRIFIPYNLAYGERGAGSKIPPYSALIFEVELISIQ